MLFSKMEKNNRWILEINTEYFFYFSIEDIEKKHTNQQ